MITLMLLKKKISCFIFTKGALHDAIEHAHRNAGPGVPVHYGMER